MPYIPPFEQIQSRYSLSTDRGETTVSLPHEAFLNTIRGLLLCVEVDEPWYLRRNPDIADAIKAGTVKSAKHHFVGDGYFEGRLPFPILVDEAWYLQQYPEVADAIRSGALKSAQQHFDDHGYREGRLPYAM